jgi:hypothetical protein
MPKQNTRVYLGYRNGNPPQVFRASCVPTFGTHGNQFNAVVGPFRTARGAHFMRAFGQGNPHCRTVSEAERLGKLYPNATSVPYNPFA